MTGNLIRVPNPTFGHNCKISFLESYKIFPNILVRLFNLKSDKKSYIVNFCVSALFQGWIFFSFPVYIKLRSSEILCQTFGIIENSEGEIFFVKTQLHVFWRVF